MAKGKFLFLFFLTLMLVCAQSSHSQITSLDNILPDYSVMKVSDTIVPKANPSNKSNRAHTISYSLAWPPYWESFSPIPKPKMKSDVFPIIAFDFNYFNKNNFRFGISLSNHHAFSSDTFYVSPLTNPYDRISISNYQVLLNADYVYINKQKLNLYSGLAFGYCLIIREGAKSASFNGIKYQYVELEHKRAWHFNLLGINYFPLKYLGLFAELGYGYAGIIKGGIIFRSSLK